MTLFQQSKKDFNEILLTIYCFVDDFVKQILPTIIHLLERPKQGRPPLKKCDLSLSELMSLAIFRFFTGHKNWKDFYSHISNYHKKDFTKLPSYQNFLQSINKLSLFASVLLQAFCNFFSGKLPNLKFVDSTKLKVCKNKRIFNHKVCKDFAKRGKGSMGWFYGFKLHIICDEFMRILKFKFTAGNVDDRKGLEMMWNNVFGMIIADAGYIGKNWFGKAKANGKHLFTCVKANMKKVMTKGQEQLLKMRERVETVFSVLKLRMGIENTLPRSPLGHFAHYLWCLTAYQFKQMFKTPVVKPKLT